MNKESIQLASNETIIKIMKESRKKDEIIKKMFMALVISFTVMILAILGTGIYFLNTFDLYTQTEEITIEGDNAQYNSVNTKGHNNNINLGGSK